ncbi:hypothetical protein AB0O52_04310 [Arthrobacter sp. NPDC080073]|uniref:hypothetical protein n=1 Tax=Arthrobacter sp. NPDC080073 TaxID=3155919 RepID=UPI0034208EF3
MQLPGPALKMQRALRHLEETRQQILEYLQSDPYQISVETDMSTSSYLVTASHVPPPQRIALSFGDFLHNLRSALDHLARIMVNENGGIPIDGPGGTTFPILARAKPGIVDIKGGISMPRLEVLQRIQPHNLGSDYQQHPLWKLNELDNIDKHRVLHVANLVGYSSVAFFPLESHDVAITPETNRYSVSLHTTEPQRITVAKEDLHEAARAGGMHTTTVRLAEDEFCGGAHIWGLCDELYNYVRDEVLLPLVSA